jgi:hypothetical protein
VNWDCNLHYVSKEQALSGVTLMEYVMRGISSNQFPTYPKTLVKEANLKVGMYNHKFATTSQPNIVTYSCRAIKGQADVDKNKLMS